MATQESRSQTPATQTWQLRFFSFSTGKVSTVAGVEKKAVYGAMGLAIRLILYVQRDSSSSDIRFMKIYVNSTVAEFH